MLVSTFRPLLKRSAALSFMEDLRGTLLSALKQDVLRLLVSYFFVVQLVLALQNSPCNLKPVNGSLPIRGFPSSKSRIERRRVGESYFDDVGIHAFDVSS